jgi:hypothetical protein
MNVRTLLGDDAAEVQEQLFEAANVLHSTGIREMQPAKLASASEIAPTRNL